MHTKLTELVAGFQWRRHQQTRAEVLSTIRFTLNELPEAPYPEAVWHEKVDSVWQFVYHHMPAASGSTL